MKKSKSLPLLVLSLFIVACSENPTSSSSGIISDSSSEVSSSESTSPAQTEVTETVGTRALLKGIIQNYTTKNIQEVVTKQTLKTKTETITTQFRTKEVYTKTETTSYGSTSTSTNYIGYFDNIKYVVDSSTNNSASSSSVTNEEIETQLATYKKRAIDLTAIEGWKDYFEEEAEEEYGKTGTVDESYSATISGETISIRAKATKTTYSGYTTKTFNGLYQFTFMATMDTSYNLTSATLRSVYYTKDNCDTDTHLPKEDAQATNDNTYELISLTLGEVEESSATVSGAMFDISPYYISSITAEAYITSRVFDDNMMPTNSSKNTVFAGSNKIVINLLGDNGEKYYEPSTACDTETIEITASNSDYIYKGTSGWEVSEDAPAETEVILTLGNALHSNLGTITVTIAANPNASTGTGGSGETTGEIPQLYTDAGIISADGNGSWNANKNEFTISTMDTSYIAIPVTNDNSLGDYYTTIWSVGSQTGEYFDITFDTSISGSHVVLKVTPKKAGSDTMYIIEGTELNSNLSNVKISFTITIEDDSTGGGTESTYPTIDYNNCQPVTMQASYSEYTFTVGMAEGAGLILLPTTNKGPFTAYNPDWTIEYTFNNQDESICSVKFALDSAIAGYDDYVYLTITPKSKGTTSFYIYEGSTPIAIYTVSVVDNLD